MTTTTSFSTRLAPNVRQASSSSVAATTTAVLDDHQKVSAGGGGWSWATAFAAASKVQPESLDHDFLQRTSTSGAVGNDVSRVSRLAQKALDETNKLIRERNENDEIEDTTPDAKKRRKKKKSKKRLREKDCEDDDDDGKSHDMDDVVAKDKNVEEGQSNNSVVEHNKKKKKKKRKKNRQKNDHETEDEPCGSSAVVNEDNQSNVKDESSASIQTVSFPYPTEEEDHCETPLVAYHHVSSLLGVLENLWTDQPLAIYDPYYCNGSVVRHLSTLGYDQVYNRKEDCYAQWNKKKDDLPRFDVLLTNPPYSGHHIDRLMQYATTRRSGGSGNGNLAWFLLMPTWVHKRDCYVRAIGKDNHVQPFYLVPQKRYVYEPPPRFRVKKVSATHKKSSPFCSMWYVWGGSPEVTQRLYEHCRRMSASGAEFNVARSKSALRDLRRRKNK